MVLIDWPWSCEWERQHRVVLNGFAFAEIQRPENFGTSWVLVVELAFCRNQKLVSRFLSSKPLLIDDRDTKTGILK